jgi:hypothetical protein
MHIQCQIYQNLAARDSLGDISGGYPNFTDKFPLLAYCHIHTHQIPFHQFSPSSLLQYQPYNFAETLTDHRCKKKQVVQTSTSKYTNTNSSFTFFVNNSHLTFISPQINPKSKYLQCPSFNLNRSQPATT